MDHQTLKIIAMLVILGCLCEAKSFVGILLFGVASLAIIYSI